MGLGVKRSGEAAEVAGGESRRQSNIGHPAVSFYLVKIIRETSTF